VEACVVGQVDFIERLYKRFNSRDIEALLSMMSEDVVWANGMKGGHIHGREGVRSYWSHQWALIDPHVEPVSSSLGSNGEIVVEVHQVVCDLNGMLLSDKRVSHVFQMENRVIKRFDIRGS
jgi:ketosteroid isomerase-like protein